MHEVPDSALRPACRSRPAGHGLRRRRFAEGLLQTGSASTLDKRGNVVADQKSYLSSVEKVYACGDMRRGQSLVVWAIREGRQAAHAVDKALMGRTVLPR